MFEYVDPRLAIQLTAPESRGEAARKIGVRGLIALARNRRENPALRQGATLALGEYREAKDELARLLVDVIVRQQAISALAQLEVYPHSLFDHPDGLVADCAERFYLARVNPSTEWGREAICGALEYIAQHPDPGRARDVIRAIQKAVFGKILSPTPRVVAAFGSAAKTYPTLPEREWLIATLRRWRKKPSVRKDCDRALEICGVAP